MLQPRWRVQVWSPLGEVIHESTFKSQDSAEQYFDSLYLPRSVKRWEVRNVGDPRFRLIKREEMLPAKCRDGRCDGSGWVDLKICTCRGAP